MLQLRCTNVKLIILCLPEPYIEALDQLVKEKMYPSRAEAIRTAVHDLLVVEAWGKKRKEMANLEVKQHSFKRKDLCAPSSIPHCLCCSYDDFLFKMDGIEPVEVNTMEEEETKEEEGEEEKEEPEEG